MLAKRAVTAVERELEEISEHLSAKSPFQKQPSQTTALRLMLPLSRMPSMQVTFRD